MQLVQGFLRAVAAGRWALAALSTLILSVLAISFLYPNDAPAAPPTNFSDTLVVSGFNTIPTDVAALSDSRLLITTQAGVLYTFKGGSLTVALNLSGKICSDLERGMFGVVADPDFTNNHFIYLSYTFNKYGQCPINSSVSPVNRVSRFVWSTGSNTLSAGSEVVLLDNMPSPGGGHNVGDLAFANDGTLVVSIGDGSCDVTDGTKCGGQNRNARKMNLLLGKMLRITRDGGIPSDNPYLGVGTARCNVAGQSATGTICQETYATGFRNPFRFAIDPNASGIRLNVNDVGLNTWEEVNSVSAGGDYGWSICEGLYQTGSTSTDCSLQGAIDPVFSYGHGACNAVTGSAFVPNGIWPSTYDGKYLFGDYTCDSIWILNQGSRTDFATGADLISMAFGASGSTQALYYTTLGGEVRKIQYTGQLNRPPVAKAKANPMFGLLPLNVSFDGRTSSDPDNQTLTYDWNFGDGSTHGTTAQVSHTFTTKKIFTVKLTVRDSQGATNATTLKIDAGNSQPLPVISSPGAADTFAAGQLITLEGSATDEEDGILAPSKLSWEVIKHHSDHTHPFFPPTSGNNLHFTAPDPEDLLAATNSYLEIRLTATDSNGLKKTISQNIQPRKIDLTFATDPPGLKINIEGSDFTGPAVITAWEGWTLDVAAPASQLNDAGQIVQWVSWSDGGARSRGLVTPNTPASFTATYTQIVGPAGAPVADARVREASPGTNYGTSTSLEINGGNEPDIETYLRFDVDELTGPVDSATLWLFVANGTTNGPTVFQASTGWSETGITWNNRPARSGFPIADSAVIPGNSWVSFDVTDAVTSSGPVSFALVGDSTDGMTARSREAASNQPRLLVVANTNGDIQPPSTPIALTVIAPAWNRVELTWEESTDNVGVTGYEIFRDDVLLQSVGAVATYADTTVVGGNDYEYQVRARDGAGNRSAKSDVAAVTTPAQTTTKTFASVADARVQENHPTTRYGASTVLRVEGGSDPDIESYIRFNVSGSTGSVLNATLRVFVPAQSGYGTVDGPAVFSAGNNWSESTITWNARPPRTLTPHDDQGALPAGAWVEFDVTGLVGGDGAVTLVIAGLSPDEVIFSSREGATPPQLIVETAFGGPAQSTEIEEPPAPTATVVAPVATSVPTAATTTVPDATATPSLTIVDGFESGDLSSWENVSGLTVQQQFVATGVWAARVTSNGSDTTSGLPSYADRGTGAPRNELFAAIRFKVIGQGDKPVSLLSAKTENGAVVARLVLSDDSRIAVADRDGRLRPVGVALNGEWHSVQAHALAAEGVLEVWLDGSLVYRETDRSGTAEITKIRLGEERTDRTYDIAIDDLIIDRTCIGRCPDAEPTPRPTELPAQAPTVTPTDVPTETPLPTETPQATETPEPPTPEPTVTPEEQTPQPTEGTDEPVEEEGSE